MAGYLQCDKCGKPLGDILYRIYGEVDKIRVKRNIRLHSEYSYDLCGRCYKEVTGMLKKEDISQE